MKSVFETSWFGSRGLPGYAAPSLGGALGAVRLGQETTTPVTPGSPDSSDVLGLKSGIEGLLKQLPPDVLGSYDTKYQQCLSQLDTGGAVGLASGGKCLYALYNEIKDFLEKGPRKPPPAPAPAPEFPVLPAVVGGLGLIVLIWGLSKL